MKDVIDKKDTKAPKKDSSKVLSQRRIRRHRLLAFYRMFRYGFDSFIRNSWLSAAATIVMVLTLLIIFIVYASQLVMTDTIVDLRNKVDMSIYLKTETTADQASEVMTDLRKLSSVKSLKYISADDARKQIIAESGEDNQAIVAALSEATNKNPATIRVVVNDINDTTQLEDFVKTNAKVKTLLSEDYKPSFAGERRSTIKSIGRAVDFVQKVGIGAGALFVIISALIIFNTIRMAIFNRKEEIQMMKLIGANKSFIRGPFLVESMIYGLIAAFVSCGLGYWALFSSVKTMTSYQIIVQPTIHLLVGYIWIVIPGMILIGSAIGIVSSLLATHKYLRI